MGKITVLISTTLDGFVDSHNVIIDPEFFEITHALTAKAEIAAFGRKTFEMFQARWPERLRDKSTPEWVRKMAQSLHDIPKVVFSSTLKETTWHNSTIVNKLDALYISDFKQNSKGTLLTVGSVSLIEQLTAMNVVDDYYFNVQPLLPGKGETRLFGGMTLAEPLSLQYVDAIPQASGAHVLHYKKGESRSPQRVV